MKSPTSNPGAALTRVALFFCTALVLSATVSCGERSSWSTTDEPGWETRQDYLEAKVDRIRLQIDRDKSQSERADFWRIASVLLALLVFVALVGGAALGSRARRNNAAFDETTGQEESLTEIHDEVVC